MPTYRPRCAALLRVPAPDGELVEFPVRVRRAWWEVNDHAHADTLKLTVEWRDAGADPRLFSSATVEFYMGQADEFGLWTPSKKDVRFVGTLERAQRSAKLDEGLLVELEFQDYTSFFLNAKLPSLGIPDYSQTLADAWTRICDFTGFAHPSDPHRVLSTVGALRDKLVPVGAIAYNWPPSLGRAAAPRFARLAAKVPTQPNADAWAVWQQCVGMCGLISFMRKDECIVTLAQDYYSDADPPRFVWGRTVGPLNEARSAQHGGKGVGLSSYDPINQTTIEAFYPPREDPPKKKKKHHVVPAGMLAADQYEIFPYPGVTDPEMLQALCYRVWEERSRQDLEGTLSTPEMQIPTVSGASFDVLALSAGDTIRVDFEAPDRAFLSRHPSLSDRVRYLEEERGYTSGVAELMARSFDTFTRLKPEFSVRRLTIDVQPSGSSPSFEAQITYCSRLQVGGGKEDAPWI